MKIKTALILCAGFGKRLNPITLEKPKPLLTLNNITDLLRMLMHKERTFYIVAGPGRACI